MRIRSVLALSVSAIAISAFAPKEGAQAQTAEPAGEGAPAIETIVVTGTGVPVASNETLQSVDVLDVDEIVETFSGSLGDTLAQLPGVSSSYFGPASGRPIIRGLGGDRVRVLNNGVGLIDASTASVDHAVTVEALDAERIEILRGPAAIAYGGNAVGGVVNVIDGRIPTSPVDGPFDGQLVLGGTTVDDGFLGAGRIRTGIGPLVLQLEASHREGDEFDIPGFAESARQRALEEAEHEDEHDDDHEGEDDHDEDHDHEDEEETRGFVENSDYEFTTFGGGAAFIGDWGNFGVSIRDYDAEYGLPGHSHSHGHDHDDEEHEGEDHDEEEHDEDHDHEEEEEGDARLVMEQLRVDARGEFNVALGPFDRLTFSLGWADYEHAEIEGSGEIGTLFENDGWETRIALRNGERGDLWSGSIGVQALRRDFSALGEEAFVQPVVTEDIGIFGAQRYDRGGWGLEGGARFESRDLDPSVGASRSFDLLSVSGGAFWRPSDDSFLGVSLSRTERAPTDVELFANGPHLATNAFEIGDPNLDVETAWSLQANYTHDHGPWRVEAGAFYTQFEDFIFLAPNGEEEDDLPVFLFLQDDATLWGWEVFAAADLGAWRNWSFSGDAAFDYVRAETDNLGDVPQIPPFSATVGLEAATSLVSLRGEVEHVAEQDDVAAFELPTDSYTFLNLSAVITPPVDADIRIILEARNVTDEEGRVHSSFLKDLVPLPGRSFGARISARF